MDEQFIIKENPEVFERIRFLHRFKVIPSIEDSVDFLAKMPLDWFKTNFIVHEPIRLNDKKPKEPPTYQIQYKAADKIILEVRSTGETMMILNNAYNSGWRIKIDGKKDIVHRVNAYFQGIRILPGIHRYELYYLPPNFLSYSLISLSSILLICAMGYIYHRRRSLSD